MWKGVGKLLSAEVKSQVLILCISVDNLTKLRTRKQMSRSITVISCITNYSKQCQQLHGFSILLPLPLYYFKFLFLCTSGEVLKAFVFAGITKKITTEVTDSK